MKTILVCDSYPHAELCDRLVLAKLEDAGIRANAWSDVYTDGERYGIIWAAPVSDLFGQPEEFPELELVEDTEGLWQVVRPTEDPDAGLV
jgi:hypothetical protein